MKQLPARHIVAAVALLMVVLCTAEMSVQPLTVGPTVTQTAISTQSWTLSAAATSGTDCSTIVQNLGPADVYVRHTDTSSQLGYYLSAGQSVTLGGTIRVAGAVYAKTVQPGVTSTVNVIREAR